MLLTDHDARSNRRAPTALHLRQAHGFELTKQRTPVRSDTEVGGELTDGRNRTAHFQRAVGGPAKPPPAPHVATQAWALTALFSRRERFAPNRIGTNINPSSICRDNGLRWPLTESRSVARQFDGTTWSPV